MFTKKLSLVFLLLITGYSFNSYSATEEVIATISEVWATSPDNSNTAAQGGGWIRFNPILNLQTLISCDAEYIFIKSNAQSQMSVALLAYSQEKQIRVKLNDSIPKYGSYSQADHIILF